MGTRDSNKMQNLAHLLPRLPHINVPFGVTYEKIGTIQRRLAWPLHKDDTLSRSGRSTDLNIYFLPPFYKQSCVLHNTSHSSRLLPIHWGNENIFYVEYKTEHFVIAS